MVGSDPQSLMTSELLMIFGSHRRWRGSAGALALALALCGCWDSGKAPVTKPDPQPGFTADSPVKAVRLLEWCWQNRDLARYDELVTDDFLFCCAANDSPGMRFVPMSSRASTRSRSRATCSWAAASARPPTSSRSSSTGT